MPAELPLGLDLHVDTIAALSRARTHGSAATHHPVMTVEGSRGYGKTALLNAAHKLMVGRTPHALIRLGGSALPADGAGVLALALQLAGKLGERIPGHPDLRFPRLSTAVIALSAGPPDPVADQAQARNAMKGRLREHAGLADSVGDLGQLGAAVVSQTSQSPQPPTAEMIAAALRLSLATTGRVRSWLRTRKPPEWFARRRTQGAIARTRGRDAGLDALLELTACWHSGQPQDTNAVAVTLVAALIADVAECCAAESRRVLLLLDDAGTGVGPVSLSRFCEALPTLDGEDRDRSGALTVVATGPPGLRNTLDARWPDLPGTEAHTITLTPLTVADARIGAARHGARAGRDLLVARSVLGLTGGHPAATARLVDALAARTGVPDLAAAFEAEEDYLVTAVIGDPAAAGIEALTTSAAARSRAEAQALLPPAMWTSTTALPELADLWPANGGIPFLRRLLLRRLAARPDDERHRWLAVHENLARGADATHRPYYLVGAGMLPLAAEHLAARLQAGQDLLQWLNTLRDAATAPRRGTAVRPGTPAARLALDLCDPTAAGPDAAHWQRVFSPPGGPPDAALTGHVLNLLAHCVVAADPLAGVYRTGLYDQLAIAVHHVTAKFGVRGEGLGIASDWHRSYHEAAELWRPVEPDPLPVPQC